MTSFTMRETEIGHKNSIGGALDFGGWWMWQWGVRALWCCGCFCFEFWAIMAWVLGNGVITS